MICGSAARMRCVALSPLFPGALNQIDNLLCPFFRPLEFAGQEEKPKRNKNKRRPRRYHHHHPRSKQQSAHDTNDDLSRSWGDFVEAKESPCLIHPPLHLLIRHNKMSSCFYQIATGRRQKQGSGVCYGIQLKELYAIYQTVPRQNHGTHGCRFFCEHRLRDTDCLACRGIHFVYARRNIGRRAATGRHHR